MRILVIDDDPGIIDLIQLTFELGWPEVKLIQAETGREGIKLIESEFPNVIVLDLGLPDINGFEVLKEIRRFSGLPILALIPNDDEKAIVKVFTWGANGCLIKPFRQMELLARVKALSGNRRVTSPEPFSGQSYAETKDHHYSDGHGHKKTHEALGEDKHVVGQCPKCSSILVYQEGNFICPVCGFSG